VIVYVDSQIHHFVLPEDNFGSSEGTIGSGLVCHAPMAGKVVKVFVKPGDQVKKGASLVVMEAMKMEHVIKAPFQGVIASVPFQTGDFVEGGKVVVSFQKPENDKKP